MNRNVLHLGQAFAWLLHNRAQAARAYRHRTGRRHPQFGTGGIAEAAAGIAQALLVSGLRPPAWPDHRPGRVPDPTHGALYVHAHWESPAWAACLRATALIGPFLFLTLPPER